jgi:hypothetical protein
VQLVSFFVFFWKQRRLIKTYVIRLSQEEEYGMQCTDSYFRSAMSKFDITFNN